MSKQYTSYPEGIKALKNNPERVAWHEKALWFVKEKKGEVFDPIPEWEELRELASQIKAHTFSHLDTYLSQLEANAIKNGITIHWANNAEEHNHIVHSILECHKGKKIIKNNSMLTEECGLNLYLQSKNVEIINTDLGERTVQLAKEYPSHIVPLTADKKKEETSTTNLIKKSAQQELKQHLLEADVNITDVDFAIAETGGFVICTNEGDIDIAANLAQVHIACMGIEKVIPKVEHLGVFLRLLARSNSGRPINTYSSHFHKPQDGKEMHLIIVDNGRTELLDKSDFKKSLNNIPLVFE